MNQTSEGNKLNLNDSGTTQIIRKYVHNIMENRMDKTFALLEFDQIKNTLKTYTHTKQATDMVIVPTLVAYGTKYRWKNCFRVNGRALCRYGSLRTASYSREQKSTS